ncbi:Phthalate 4,5-dioxygenase oxygenase reductase subunit [Paraburkholderia sediminicola]|uniref:Phthalate 4,5-dioxygenase oxygenase reductase subunit n=1 Tax=Paraburkholderia sediminicola TaxID=458836 RepID=A0A6J5CWM5_9BURK|nr:PDR/VanB family oxidoreductase [Paraburkholderia sediminicola]CAB3745540.1 Phthalate 4,5-dioxygenase oxygenase reductase subunit [Paraburkholderia sediminicola]
MSSIERIEVVVSRKVKEADDIFVYDLQHAEGLALPAFSAGSHVDVHLPNGITRQYSLCNDPEESQRYTIAVLREPRSRGGSSAMHDSVQQGDRITISAPKNHFPLVHSARRTLLFAGGIGITPILCMAERLAKTNADFELHYCTRTWDRTAFRDRIGASPFSHRVHHYLSEGDGPSPLNLEPVLREPSPGTHIYVCGPFGFIEFVLNGARELGWSEEQLHKEFFSASIPKPKTDDSFEVVLASTGRSVRVNGDQTVIDALASVGVNVQTSCEQGVCGTCLTRVLSGEPDHRDMYLSLAEREANDQFLPCCSRSKSPVLVLDL